MPVQNDAKKAGILPIKKGQVCARGWQDYMMETCHFLGETRVDECLRTMSNPQLEKLGLTQSEVAKIRSR